MTDRYPQTLPDHGSFEEIAEAVNTTLTVSYDTTSFEFDREAQRANIVEALQLIDARVRSDLELAEAENENLRSALAWAAGHLPDTLKNELEKRLDHTIEKGGVTGTTAEDHLHEAVDLIRKMLAHVEGLMTASRIVRQDGSRYTNSWFARLDDLLTSARGYTPKHPLMRRIGGHPNVFAPVGDVGNHVERVTREILGDKE